MTATPTGATPARASFDIAVIGGGIVGLSIALHAAAAGSRTVVIERGTPGAEASGRSGGVVRQQGRRAAQLPLAARAVAHWAGLDTRLGRPAGFSRSGHIEVAASEAEHARQRMQRDEERRHGIDTRLVDGDELRRRVPGIGAAAIGGKYCEADGHAVPEVALDAFTQACRDGGVVLLTNTVVTGFEAEGTRLASIATPRGRIEAGTVVNAAGAWAPLVAQWADAYLPIAPSRGHLALTAPLPLFSEHVVASASRDFLAVPRAEGGYLVGSRQPDPSSFSYSRSVRAASIERLRGGLERFAPSLSTAAFARSWAGTRECTPDAMPIIGPVQDVDNFFTCAGFSGEGFALAPLVGELVAGWLRTGERPALLADYGVERFFQGADPWIGASAVSPNLAQSQSPPIPAPPPSPNKP